jgi:hypothetical protein
MKRPTFNHGIIVAAVLGFFASALVATLTPFLGLGAVAAPSDLGEYPH